MAERKAIIADDVTATTDSGREAPKCIATTESGSAVDELRDNVLLRNSGSSSRGKISGSTVDPCKRSGEHRGDGAMVRPMTIPSSMGRTSVNVITRDDLLCTKNENIVSANSAAPEPKVLPKAGRRMKQQTSSGFIVDDDRWSGFVSALTLMGGGGLGGDDDIGDIEATGNDISVMPVEAKATSPRTAPQNVQSNGFKQSNRHRDSVGTTRLRGDSGIAPSLSEFKVCYDMWTATSSPRNP